MSDLSHLEYRVWTQSMLSADDFGVLRLSAVTLQADNDALAQEPPRTLEKALRRLVDVGLLLAFDHQGRTYACHPVWQDHQKIEYPRETIQPMPTSDVLAECSEATRQLFGLWPKPPRRTRAERSPNIPRTLAEHSPNVSNLARAQPRETAEAKAKGLGGVGDGEAFWETWRELFRQTQHGATVPDLQPRRSDGEHIVALVTSYPDGAYLAQMARLFLLLEVPDLKGKPRSIGMFRHWAPWCDAELRKNGYQPGTAA